MDVPREIIPPVRVAVEAGEMDNVTIGGITVIVAVAIAVGSATAVTMTE
jgi:hypothetical protein